MDPVTHGAVAYLLYVAYALVSSHRLPARWALVPLAVGSQFPDLVDKPLAYWGVLAYGRSLAHSVFSLLFVCGVVWLVVRSPTLRLADWLPAQVRRLTPAAFTIGYAAHLLGDAWRGLFSGDLFSVRFLAYPLFGVPQSPSDNISPLVRVLELYREPAATMHLEIVGAAVLVFVGVRVWAVQRGRGR